MKELAGSAANTFFLPCDKDGIQTRIEVVLLHSEVTYHPALSGMEKSRSLDAFRFLASPKELLNLANHFTELVDAARQQEAKVRGWTDEEIDKAPPPNAEFSRQAGLPAQVGCNARLGG